MALAQLSFICRIIPTNITTLIVYVVQGNGFTCDIHSITSRRCVVVANMMSTVLLFASALPAHC